MPITNEIRIELFSILKNELKKCVPPMVVSKDIENESFELIGNKSVLYGFDKKMISGMFFASLAQRKDSVTFHFFPSYMNDEMNHIAPNLYKFLKGKTCFHFKKSEQVDLEELRYLLKKGIVAWKKSGFMN